jgi:hypothetical protein
MGTGVDYVWSYPTSNNNILSGLSKGSTAITVGDASPFVVGKMVKLSVENDPNIPVFSVADFPGSRTQMTMVTAKSGNTLNIWPALYDNYGKNGSLVKVSASTKQMDFSGVEDLTIDANGVASDALWFGQAYGSWVKNIRIVGVSNRSITFSDSLNSELRHSFIDEGKINGTNGYGLGTGNTSGSLFEDNIFFHNSPSIEINAGSAGNVIAYNYSVPISVDMDSNHAPHNHFNLFEGNIFSHLISDGYFGSESHQVIFRNWAQGGGWWAINLKRFSRDFSVIGNLIGFPGLNKSGGNECFGTPNIGNDAGLDGENGYAPPWWWIKRYNS